MVPSSKRRDPDCYAGTAGLSRPDHLLQARPSGRFHQHETYLRKLDWNLGRLNAVDVITQGVCRDLTDARRARTVPHCRSACRGPQAAGTGQVLSLAALVGASSSSACGAARVAAPDPPGPCPLDRQACASIAELIFGPAAEPPFRPPSDIRAFAYVRAPHRHHLPQPQRLERDLHPGAYRAVAERGAGAHRWAPPHPGC